MDKAIFEIENQIEDMNEWLGYQVIAEALQTVMADGCEKLAGVMLDEFHPELGEHEKCHILNLATE